jgi:hypothetical protein
MPNSNDNFPLLSHFIIIIIIYTLLFSSSLLLLDYEEIKNKTNTGNVCCHSVSTNFFLPSRLLSKNLKIETHKAVILLYCSVWVWNLVAHIKGETQTEGVWKQGAEENICT